MACLAILALTDDEEARGLAVEPVLDRCVEVTCKRGSQTRRHCVANLSGDLGLGALELERVGKGLQTGRLAVGDGPVRLWVQVAPFSGLKNSFRIVTLGLSHQRRPMTSVVPVGLLAQQRGVRSGRLRARSNRLPPGGTAM